MAAYSRHNCRVNVLVKVDGKQHSKTFDTKAEAIIWVTGHERQLKNPDRSDLPVMQSLKPFSMLPGGCNTRVTCGV